jgi:hypothetical protein
VIIALVLKKSASFWPTIDKNAKIVKNGKFLGVA